MSTTKEEPPRPQRPEPLPGREGRRPLGVPHEGFPAHLDRQLRVWLDRYLIPDLDVRGRGHVSL